MFPLTSTGRWAVSGLSPANNPHGAGWKKISQNEPVYIDYTCVVNGYTADAQRVFVLGSKPLDDTLMHGFKTALLIQEEATKKLKARVSMLGYLEAVGGCRCW